MSDNRFSPPALPRSALAPFDTARSLSSSARVEEKLPDTVNNWDTPTEIRNAFIDRYWRP